jgi:hypothetical protein
MALPHAEPDRVSLAADDAPAGHGGLKERRPEPVSTSRKVAENSDARKYGIVFAVFTATLRA